MASCVVRFRKHLLEWNGVLEGGEERNERVESEEEGID